MTFTSDEATMVDEMNSAAGKSELGTEVLENQTDITALEAIAGASGEYTVVTADDTAGTKAIDTGVTVNGWLVQIFRAGVMVMEDAVATAATTILTIADGAATYALTADDVIHWMVW